MDSFLVGLHYIYNGFDTLTFTGSRTANQLELKKTQKHLKKGALVIFEELLFEGQLIAEHKDINDIKQTIPILEITAAHLTLRNQGLI